MSLDVDGAAPGARAPAPGLFSSLRLLGYAMRESLRGGYSAAALRADVAAGIVVGIIALPLSMALGIASGTPPEHGLYTAIVAGTVTALLGGSHMQVTGPTAAFVVLLVPVSTRYGLGGLALASVMAGLMLFAMGMFRLGGLVRYVPQPVILGFTGGIAVVIATLQLKDFLGLTVPHMPESYLGKVGALAQALPTLHLPDLAIGLLTLATLLTVPKLTTKIPAPLIALLVAGLLGGAIDRMAPEQGVRTIAKRFSFVERGVRKPGIPHKPPRPGLHWFQMGAHGETLVVDGKLLRDLAPNAFAIAMLAAIESLLAAVVADRMSKRRHNSDAELLAVGLANIAAPFFGGFAATGAIARTATNIRSGARTPLASVYHAGFVLLSMMLLAPYLGHLPMSALAALLLTMAYRMGDLPGIAHAMRHAPRSDAFLLALSLTLTVVFDMVVSVGAGLIVATLIFCYRMAQTTQLAEVAAAEGDDHIVQVRGPLFFGAAARALAPLSRGTAGAHAATSVIVDLTDVSVVDSTGLMGLEEAVAALRATDTEVVFVNARANVPSRALTHHFVQGGGTQQVQLVKSRADAQSALNRSRHHVAASAATTSQA